MMNARFLVATLIIGGSVSLTACGGEDLGDPTGSTCPSDSALTYANFGQGFFQAHCLSCHTANGPESPKLDTLAQIRAKAGDIDRAAASGPKGTNTFMPDGASVDKAEREKLGEWLACGAPE